jgi:hypothetical protein
MANPLDADEVWLFAYGTLRQREVQLAIFGRRLAGRADVLPGYALSPLCCRARVQRFISPVGSMRGLRRGPHRLRRSPI